MKVKEKGREVQQERRPAVKKKKKQQEHPHLYMLCIRVENKRRDASHRRHKLHAYYNRVNACVQPWTRQKR